MSARRIAIAVLALSLILIGPASLLAAGASTPKSQTYIQPSVSARPGGSGGGSPPSKFVCPTITGADSSVCSTNWSGYAVTASSGTVSSVSGSFIVPTVTCSSKSTTYAAVWVGIDGYSDSTVEQTGILADCSGGVASYSAWYEFYPNPSVTISSVTVSPGDTITASVTYSTSTGQFTDSISSSGGGSYSTSAAVSGAERSSAEWIVERPEVCSGRSCSLTTLSDFGVASLGSDYTGVSGTGSATISGVTGTISSFTTAAITMVSGSSGPVLAEPGSLSSDGTSFQVTYE